MTSDVTNSSVQIQVERKKLKRELTLLPLFGLIYFTVCGGSFGIEPLVGWSGPGPGHAADRHHPARVQPAQSADGS